MKKRPHSYTVLPRYRTFSAKRDAALEAILMKARVKCADILRAFMCRAQTEIQRVYPTLNIDSIDPRTIQELQALDRQLTHSAYNAAQQMALAWSVARSRVFALANASEQAALLSCGSGFEPRKISMDELLSAAYQPTDLGGSPIDRAVLAMNRLRRKIMDAVELSRVLGEDVRAATTRALDTLPRPQRYAGPLKDLPRLKEADRPTIGALRDKTKLDFADFVDEDERDAIVGEYVDKFVPEWRDPRYGELPSPVAVGEKNGFVSYPWELEQEITEDFVQAVEQGRHAGAKAQGITKFVWVAVVDSHTDECCLKRDGLTTTEIAEKLKGEWADDECQAKVTPAHFKCRCRLVPATDDLPDVPASNAADFEEWLNA